MNVDIAGNISASTACEASATVERAEGPSGKAGAGGRFKLECFDRDGNLKWSEEFPNSVCLAALDSMNNVYLRGVTPITTWYLGLIDNAGFTALAAADTAASHAGWSENIAYTGGVRPTWTPAASSGQSVANATQVSFTSNATSTIRGLFVISDSTQGGTAGTLFATAALSAGNQLINSGDVLKATYTFSLTASS